MVSIGSNERYSVHGSIRWNLLGSRWIFSLSKNRPYEVQWSTRDTNETDLHTSRNTWSWTFECSSLDARILAGKYQARTLIVIVEHEFTQCVFTSIATIRAAKFCISWCCRNHNPEPSRVESNSRFSNKSDNSNTDNNIECCYIGGCGKPAKLISPH